MELGPLLYDRVNPEALDSLIVRENGSSTVEFGFSIDGYRVEVDDTGHVVVREWEP